MFEESIAGLRETHRADAFIREKIRQDLHQWVQNWQEGCWVGVE